MVSSFHSILSSFLPKTNLLDLKCQRWEKKTCSNLAIGVSYLYNLCPYKTQSISACFLLSLLRFEIFLSGVFLSYFRVLSKTNYSFDLLSLFLLWPEAQSISEIIEICMGKGITSAMVWPRHFCFGGSAVLSSSGHQKPQDREWSHSPSIRLFPRSHPSTSLLWFFYDFIS